MGDKTQIEWTDATWNPVTGCTKVSAGCKNCYAQREWARLSAPRAQPIVYTGRKFEDVACHPERLDQVLRWRKGRRIFVNAMSDLFHPDVPFHFIDDVVMRMRMARQHTFQVLTKRPERMIEWAFSSNSRHGDLLGSFGGGCADNPPANIWWGVSCENQETAQERIPLLLQMPAAVRWISAEPLLGSLNLMEWLWEPTGEWRTLRGRAAHRQMKLKRLERSIDWVVAGGESGPRARPSHPDWFRALRDQCAQAGVPLHFKQWGEWRPMRLDEVTVDHGMITPLVSDGSRKVDGDHLTLHSSRSLVSMLTDPACGWQVPVRRVGKKAAGRELDGVVHDAYPADGAQPSQPAGSLSTPPARSSLRQPAGSSAHPRPRQFKLELVK